MPRVAVLAASVLASVAVLGLFTPSASEASCAGPALALGDASSRTPGPAPLVPRRTSVQVTGEFFHSGCNDYSTCRPGCLRSTCTTANEERPLQDVQLRLIQGDRSWPLGEADATGPRHATAWTVELPATARPGPARLEAGPPRPGARLEVVLR